MAKKQTRRSISIGRARVDQAKLVAETIGASLSRFCEDALDAYIASGPKPIPRSSDVTMPETPSARTPRAIAASSPPAPPAPPAPVDPNAPIPWSCNPTCPAQTADCKRCPRPTCTVCTEPCMGDHYYRLPLGKDDARVVTCDRYVTEHPRSGGYTFNGSEAQSRNTGSLNTGSRMLGKNGAP